LWDGSFVERAKGRQQADGGIRPARMGLSRAASERFEKLGVIEQAQECPGGVVDFF